MSTTVTDALDRLTSAIGGGGGAGGGGVMIVTLDTDTDCLDASYNQLMDALTAGKHIDFHLHEGNTLTVYALVSINQDSSYYYVSFKSAIQSLDFESDDPDAQMAPGED